MAVHRNRLPGEATWQRYGIIAQRIVDETPKEYLVEVITAMLRKAHEKGAFAMQAKAVEETKKVVKRQLRSRQLQAMALIKAIRELEHRSALKPRDWHINNGRHDFLWRRIFTEDAGIDFALASAEALGKPPVIRPALDALNKERAHGPREAEAVAAGGVPEPLRRG